MLKITPYSWTVLLGVLAVYLAGAGPSPLAAESYYAWRRDGTEIPAPLAGLKGNTARGEQIVIRQDKGNCLACHTLPVGDGSFHGTIGPPLHGVAARRSEGQLRLHIVDQQQLNPATIMPGFYKNTQELNRVLDEYLGTTLLSAQEVEDVVAYLMTLE